MTLPTRALGRSGLEITVQCSLRPIGASGDDEIKWENKLSHCTYSASRFVYEVPGPIGPGYSPFAPSALRKTSPNSLAVEQVNGSSKLSQNVLIFAHFGKTRRRARRQNPQIAPNNKDSPRITITAIVTSDSIKPSEGSVSRRCEGGQFACFTPRSEK